MGGKEAFKNVVIPLEVERVITSEGIFSIYQFHANRLEAIETFVATSRVNGIHFELPKLTDKVAQPQLEHEKIEFEKFGRLPVIVYLAGPPNEDTVFEVCNN